MDVREKLVKLVEYMDGVCPSGVSCYNCPHKDIGEGCSIQAKVDYLMNNGVTVQEWISVKDRLPKDRNWVLVNHTGYDTPKKAKYKDDFSPHIPVFLIDGDNGNKGEVTHWMHLPQPPKGD